MKPRLTFLAVIAAMLTVPTMAQDEIYSTLAARKNAKDGWAVGYALGYSTASESVRAAQGECSKYGLGQCTPLFTQAGPVCVAIAEGDDGAAGWGGGGDVTRVNAEASALKKCGEFGDNCRVTASDCTGDGSVVKSDFIESDDPLIESDDPLLGRWEGDVDVTFPEGPGDHGSINLDINEKLSDRSYSGIMNITTSSNNCGGQQRMSISLPSGGNVNMRGEVLTATCDSWSPDNFRLRLHGDKMTGSMNDTAGASGNNVQLIKVN